MSSKNDEYIDEQDYLSDDLDAEGESCEGQESEPELEAEGEQCFESLDDIFANQPKASPPLLQTQQQPVQQHVDEPEVHDEEEAEGEGQDSEESDQDLEEIKFDEIIGDQEIYSADKKTKVVYCDYEGDKQLTTNVKSSITTTFNKEDQNRMRIKDKNDRATVDQVLDPRTLRILHKWLKNGTLSEIFGSVSTGKEANVYYAYRKPSEKIEEEIQETAKENTITESSISKKDLKRYRKEMRHKHEDKVSRAALSFDTEKDFALKIYKTTILVFRDRERYVEGEYRFRKTRYKNNPLKMVMQWAEKEMRNLKRLKSVGLNVPEAYLLKSNIIIMEFIGDKGLAAPRLKDADLSEAQMNVAYFDVLKIMRKMYQDCKMVHGDLSEYNLLYYKDLVYVIDVSQSVEHDHPMSLDFLRRDCVNVNDYFHKQGIQVLSTEKTYDFVTDYKIKADKVEDTLKQFLDETIEMKNKMTKEELRNLEIADKVFRNIDIPRSLMDIDFEEIDKLKYSKELQEISKQKEEGEDNESDDNENSEERIKKKKYDPFENMTKKERKQKVREENRERRKNKMPKHLKKKLIKKGGNKK